MRKTQPEVYRARTDELERAVLGYVPPRKEESKKTGMVCECTGEALCSEMWEVAQAIRADIYAQGSVGQSEVKLA